MDISSCYQLGYVIKTHGLKGEIIIFLDVDIPENYQDLESVFVEIDKKLIPFFVERFQLRGDKAIVKLEDIDNIEDAKSLKASRLFLPLDVLPELEEDQFYFHEIIGFTMVDKVKGDVGEIKDVFDMTGQDLMAVEHEGKEVLVPINDQIITKVDKTNHKIFVSLPEGLLDI